MSSRHSLALAALLLSACGGSPPARTTPAPTPQVSEAQAEDRSGIRSLTPQENIIIRRYRARVERLRELRFLREVPVEVWTSARIAQHLSESVEDEELQESKSLYVALGLLAPESDIRAALEAVIGEQVVGFYDHRSGKLIIRDDVMASLGQNQQLESELVILHELVHALQDQHFDLRGRLSTEDRTVDMSNGLRALIEGDATLAMLAGNLPERALAAMRAAPLVLDATVAGPAASEALRASPAIIRVSFTAPYLAGLRFCATLLSRGGWPAVDRAFAEPPRSVEQVLHPQAFLDGEEPVAIELPTFPSIEAAGYAAADDETLGELELAVYFGQRNDATDARAAAGWAGDRLRVYEREGSPPAAVWFTRWDDEAEAQEAATAAEAVSSVGGVVRRTGSAVLIVRQLPSNLLPEVEAAFESWAAR